MYDNKGDLTGFGREIDLLERVHKFTYDPTTNMMIKP